VEWVAQLASIGGSRYGELFVLRRVRSISVLQLVLSVHGAIPMTDSASGAVIAIAASIPKVSSIPNILFFVSPTLLLRSVPRHSSCEIRGQR
jgi:hypothetical protein